MSGVPGGPDNRSAGLERPLDMAEDELARAVRESFHRQATAPRPLPVNPADRAIRRANRTLRRRTVTGVALAAVATAVVSAGTAQLGGQAGRPNTPTVVLGEQSHPSASPGPARSAPPAVGAVRAETDLIVGASLGTTDGRQLELDGVGPIERAQRMADDAGWLVVGGPTAAGRTLWAVQPTGAVQVLLAGAATIVVGADGTRVAWRDGGHLLTAGVVGGQLVATARTPATGPATVAGVVGDTVLVRPDPARPGHTLWRPADGPPAGPADPATVQVYGSRPDGRLVGQLVDAAGRSCLALLDPTRRLAPDRSSCVPLAADGPGAVSPDGRWLLVNGDAEGGTRALLVDLDTLGSTPAVRVAGPTATGAVAWATPQSALYVDSGGNLVRLRVDRVLAGDRGTSTTLAGAGPQSPTVVVVPSRP
ncbi:hypothetical protein [Micromonospora fluostatini]|uniref:hypothetical protein n=1 Tax=Micromonospora sp. JCM 30529 TaxID=3421643 RepID=UPI003D17D70E